MKGRKNVYRCSLSRGRGETRGRKDNPPEGDETPTRASRDAGVDLPICMEHLVLPQLRGTHLLTHRTEKGEKRRQREGNDGLCEHVEAETSVDS